MLTTKNADVIITLLIDKVKRLRRKNAKLERRTEELDCQCEDLYRRLRNEELHRELNRILTPCSCGGGIVCGRCGKPLDFPDQRNT